MMTLALVFIVGLVCGVCVGVVSVLVWAGMED